MAGAGPVATARRAAFRMAARLGALVGAAWAIASVLALWLSAAEAAGRTPMALPTGALLEYAGRIAAGRGMLLTLCCALVSAGLALAHGATRTAREATIPRALLQPRRRVRREQSATRTAREATIPRALLQLRRGAVLAGGRPAGGRYPELAVGASALGLLPGPVTGHSAGHRTQDPAVLAIALHVIAAGVWVGGLLAVVVVLAPRRRLLADALARFSPAAACCAGVVALTGVLSAAFRLPAPAALVASGYGALVLAKATGLVGLLGLGWHARRRVRSGLAARRERSPAGRAVVRWLGVELAVMAVVFGLAPALASSAPA